MPLIAGVVRETFPGEQRVAMTPRAMEILSKQGVEFLVEPGAGSAAGFSDDDYRGPSARIAADRADVFATANVILQVRALGANPEAGRADLPLFRRGQAVIGFCEPLTTPEATAQLIERGVDCFAIELIPRITRAQSMDALSSMATVAGYKAVLLAANMLPRMFPLLMTAAGTITPARVFVLGAGVAGLQAIATARRLGSVVSAYDVRAAVREQVESLGAKFVAMELDAKAAEGKGGYAAAMDEEFYRRQRELMTETLREQDVVIATAAVPGKKAPILISAEMVKVMPRGSIIVDLAAERGGNCELTQPGETVTVEGVTILGPLNVPSTIPYHASQMYARNLAAFLKPMLREGNFVINPDDEIVRATLITRQEVSRAV